MKPPDVALRELVLQWLDKAAADFAVVEHLCAQPGRFREIIAFHCQQAAEKYLKAFLVLHQIEFPKTHDIAKLLDRAGTVNPSLAESLRDTDALTPFGVEVRYPSDAPELLPGEENEVIDLARRVKHAVTISLDPYVGRGQACWQSSLSSTGVSVSLYVPMWMEVNQAVIIRL